MSEVEKLREEVDRLAAQVKKNSKAIVDTGSQVLKLQVDGERRSLKSLNLGTEDRPSKVPDEESDDEESGGIKNPSGDNAEALTSNDVVELVTELQGQLDLLDERSIRRSANAVLANDDDLIAPVPGRDGGYPNDEESGENQQEETEKAPGKFPETLKEFKNIDDNVLNYWLRWYELLPPDEAELQDILEKAGATMDDLGVDKEKLPHNAITASKEEVNRNYDLLARYLGLRTRRTPGVW